MEISRKKAESAYGMTRVKEPMYVLPTSAWRVDNSREINDNEVRISIRKMHIETSNFKQLIFESANSDEKLKAKIMDIVEKRGKFHNPVTDTGGILFGVVEKIGSASRHKNDLKVGDEIICNASLATIPLYIDRITSVDRVFSQVDAEGYGIIFDEIPIVKKPKGIPLELMLLILDESGTFFTVSDLAKSKDNLLIVGNNVILSFIYGYILRRSAGPKANIVCVLDKRYNAHSDIFSEEGILSNIFNEIHYANILRPMEWLKSFGKESCFDLSINCADNPGAETINILATKDGGTVVFTNLINNYNISLYITEAVSKHLEIRCADGFIKDYTKFDIELATELAPYFDKIRSTTSKIEGEKTSRNRRKNPDYTDSIYINSLAEDLVFESRAMQAVLEEINAVSKYDCNVFISGDTGVGKEKVAGIIQKNSPRRVHPFVKVNCAAISPNLMESEFFGYDRGAFTGASQSGKKGLFELADSGTIFLDEVGELPLNIQAKLLRVVQEGEFFKVGGTSPIKTDVRIISATNRSLEAMVEEKTFRRDLYYRLNVFPIRMPNLEQRPEDIPVLVRHFIKKYSEKYGERYISDDAVEYLMSQKWPGNIRELENFVQRLLINSKNETILIFDITKELNPDLFTSSGQNALPIAPKPDAAIQEIDLSKMVGEYEMALIKYACEKYGSTRKAAKAIGISQTQLVRKKKKYGIEYGTETED